MSIKENTFFAYRLNQHQQMERIEVQSTACLPDIKATHSIILHLCRSFTPLSLGCDARAHMYIYI